MAVSKPANSAAYAHLLSPGRIGTLEVRNRIFVTAMGVSLAEDDGQCGDRIIAYHEEQAKGGAGLIITGVMGVAWPVGAAQPNQSAISDDRFLPGLRRLTDAVHAHGSKIAAQLHHGGLVATYSAKDGHQLWGPSLPPPFKGDFPDAFLPEEMAAFAGAVVPQVKVLTREDIAVAVNQYAAGAARAKAAGFDAVEIHGGHGYLISSFISPYTNRRDDEYGGTLENRTRLMREVVSAVRAAVGPEFPVWIKLDSRELEKTPGITLEDAKQAAQMAERAGVDAVTVSSYHDVGKGKLHSASNIPHEPEANIPAAAAIKAVLKVPVIASGRIEPDRANAKIGAGEFDFLAMGRKLLADPHLPRKLADGDAERVRPCIYCYTCVSTAYVRQQVRCAVNSETGFEYLRDQAAPPSGRHYAVIGGGPGGMEAARRLSAAGNKVTLIERGERLGGTLRFASLAYEPNERLLNWLRGEIAASDVDVRLNTAATPDLLRSLRPDHVIVATGAVRDMPPIPGNDLPHVFSGDDLRHMMLGTSSPALRRKTGLFIRLMTKLGAMTGLTANLAFVRQATQRWMPLGRHIVIIGGELVGVELAEFLTERGRRVTVIEEGPKFGKGLTLVRRMRLIPELREHGVSLCAGVSDVRIGAKAVTFTDSAGQAHSVSADHVIVARGARGDSALAEALRAAGLAVTEIGDGTGVGYIEGAMRGAARAVQGVAAIPLT